MPTDKNSQRMLNALEPGTVLFESKDGAWEPLAEEDIMEYPRLQSKAGV